MTRRPARQCGERGTTLIELLIAITLLSILSVGMLVAIRVGLNAMDKSNSRMANERKTMGVQRILESQVEDMIPIVAECMDDSGAPASKELFFQGEPQTMRFVSSYSLTEANRGYPRILEYQVIPGDNGAVRLIVNEHIYGGPRTAGVLCSVRGPDPRADGPVLRFRPVQVGESSFVLADNLVSCQMSYLMIDEDGENPHWIPVWYKSDTLPRAIRIDMQPKEWKLTGMPPLSITAPVHLFKAPLYEYHDFWELRR